MKSTKWTAMIIATAWLLPTATIWAQTNKSAQKPTPYIAKYDSGEFELEKDLVDKIYNETQADQQTSGVRAARFIPMITYVASPEIEFIQPYFTTDYRDQLQNLTLGGMRLESGIWSYGINQFQGHLEVAYGYLQDKFDTVSSEGILATDDLKLQWLPIQTGISWALKTPLSWITPRVELGLGYHWLHQAGQLDGISQSYWLPTYSANAGVLLFESQDQNSFFPGLLLMATQEKDLGSEDSSLKTFGYKAGASFRL